MKNKTTIIPIIFLFLISFSIYAPRTIGPFISLGKNIQTENRRLLEKPQFSLENIFTYFSDYGEYFSENFPFRSALIRLHTILMVYLAHESPLPNKVVIGKNDWLFFFEDESRPQYKNEAHFTEDQLAAIKKFYDTRGKYLHQKGISYYLVIAPNAATIYPENLPFYVHNPQKKPLPSTFDQLKKLFKDDEYVGFIDVRPALIKAKGIERVFHQTDTHWNAYGALIAYLSLLDSLKIKYPDIPIHSISSYNLVYTINEGGDLAKMLGIPDIYTEKLIAVKGPNDQVIFNGNARDYLEPLYIYQSSTGSRKRILVYRDSFFSSLIPYIQNDFAATTIRTGEFQKNDLETDRPDIVISELVERKLDNYFFLGDPIGL